MRIRKRSTSSFNGMSSTHPFSISNPSMSAVMMCPLQSSDFSKDEIVIAAVYIVTSLLSIFGAGSVLIYAITKKIVRSPEVCPLFHLALADLFLAVLWFTGATLWFKGLRSCFKLDVVAEMVHLASFFLTVNYGLNAYLRLKEKAYNIRHWQFVKVHHHIHYSYLLKASYVVCWSAPVVIMLPLLVHENDPELETLNPKGCSRCLLLFDRPKARGTGQHSSQLWLAYGSVALAASLSFSIVVLLLLYFMILRIYRKAVIYSGVVTDDQRSSIDAIRSRIFLYIMVFLICWSPALMVATIDLDPRIRSTTLLKNWFVLFLFQGLTAPMQGFLNCIVYGWTRKSFRTASGRHRLFRESDEYGSMRRQRNFIGSTGSL